jgi:hypothetical protein
VKQRAKPAVSEAFGQHVDIRERHQASDGSIRKPFCQRTDGLGDSGRGNLDIHQLECVKVAICWNLGFMLDLEHPAFWRHAFD